MPTIGAKEPSHELCDAVRLATTIGEPFVPRLSSCAIAILTSGWSNLLGTMLNARGPICAPCMPATSPPAMLPSAISWSKRVRIACGTRTSANSGGSKITVR
jgi:hypothetical protein